MKRSKLIYLPLVFCLTIISCEKDIVVELPPAEAKIVVEGKIEPGLPPYVILTRNMPYFGPTDINTIQNSFVHGATVAVSDGVTNQPLTELCTQSLPDSVLPLVAQFTGIDTMTLKNFNYCLYTTFNTQIFGQFGKNYSLSIQVDGKTLTAQTSIQPAIPIDSLWYKYEKSAKSKTDSLGFIWAHLKEPAGLGNAYRWMAKRHSKDFSFLPPPGSTFNDKYIDGQNFDFAYNRGTAPGSQALDDQNEEKGYFKTGDTVVVKFCTIDQPAYLFYRSLEIVQNNDGNPFASPSSVKTNIYPLGEALGIWCGYGVAMDTVIFK